MQNLDIKMWIYNKQRDENRTRNKNVYTPFFTQKQILISQNNCTDKI
jgi:hypothetical protein